MTTATRTADGALVAGVDSSTQFCKIVVCEAETGRSLGHPRISPDRH